MSTEPFVFAGSDFDEECRRAEKTACTGDRAGEGPPTLRHDSSNENQAPRTGESDSILAVGVFNCKRTVVLHRSICFVFACLDRRPREQLISSKKEVRVKKLRVCPRKTDSAFGCSAGN